MKKIILLVLGIVFSMATFAQAVVKGPVMSFEEKSFDFADIKQGQRVTHTFTYKNTGTDTLKIEWVRTTGEELYGKCV